MSKKQISWNQFLHNRFYYLNQGYRFHSKGGNFKNILTFVQSKKNCSYAEIIAIRR